MTPASARSPDLERFPIRVLSERTSVGSSTLRAWERRYGLLNPDRTPKGHRLYNKTDIQRVLKIVDLLNDGHSLPAITDILSVQDTPAYTGRPADPTGTVAETGSTAWEHMQQLTLEAVRDFSIERIDTIYNEASSLYPVDLVTDRLIQPTLEILGIAWKGRPESGIAEEHFYSSWLKNRLGARFHHAYSQARGKRIICACTPGSHHEIGLMLFSLSALARGYRVLYFGADLPLNQLAGITQRSAARAIVLGTRTPMDKDINEGLARLMPGLGVPVFVGGSDEPGDTEAFQSAGGILLGSRVAVALRVFANHIPPHPPAPGPAVRHGTRS